MGRGSYTAGDWAKLKTSRGINQSNEVENIFTAKRASDAYNTAYIAMRESRDTDSTSESTPVIIGFDVTASMGYLAKELSVNAVNKTVTKLYEQKPISCPQVLCAAIGDSLCDSSPLQVTQFEADIRIIRQLTDLYLEGGGGGNNGESYHLLWYFAAKHIHTDCNEKRNKKGFLFTIGDDQCHPQLSTAEIKRVFGDNVSYPLSNEQLIRMAEKKFYLYHICIETDGPYNAEVIRKWLQLMPGRATVIHKNDIRYLADLILAIIRVGAGMTPNESLKTADQDIAEKIARSMALIDNIKENNNIISF